MQRDFKYFWTDKDVFHFKIFSEAQESTTSTPDDLRYQIIVIIQHNWPLFGRRRSCRLFFGYWGVGNFFSDWIIFRQSTIFLSGWYRWFWLLPILVRSTFYHENAFCGGVVLLHNFWKCRILWLVLFHYWSDSPNFYI